MNIRVGECASGNVGRMRICHGGLSGGMMRSSVRLWRRWGGNGSNIFNPIDKECKRPQVNHFLNSCNPNPKEWPTQPTVIGSRVTWYQFFLRNLTRLADSYWLQRNMVEHWHHDKSALLCAFSQLKCKFYQQGCSVISKKGKCYAWKTTIGCVSPGILLSLGWTRLPLAWNQYYRAWVAKL